jgi:hypothetical protein
VGDAETGEAIIAARDVIVTKTRATIGIMIALPSASPDEVLADLNGFTQQLRGAVVGRSQLGCRRAAATELLREAGGHNDEVAGVQQAATSSPVILDHSI